MILDLQTMFSGSVAADGTKSVQLLTATAISTNVVDLRQQATPALVDEGASGTPVYLIVQVGSVALTSGGATTLVVSLESDSTADLATSPTVHYTSVVIAKATLVANYVIARIVLPREQRYERYLGVRYTIATGPFTGGGVLASLSIGVDLNIAYPIAYTVA